MIRTHSGAYLLLMAAACTGPRPAERPMPSPGDTILIATRELRGVLVPHLPEGNAFRCHQSQSPWSVAKCEREDPVSGAKDELSLLDRWSANLLMRSRIVPKAQRDSLLASTADSLDRQWGKRDHCTMEGQLAPLHSWRKGVWGGRAMLIPMQDTVALVVMVLMVPRTPSANASKRRQSASRSWARSIPGFLPWPIPQCSA